MIEKDIQKIATEISKERSGVPVLISDLRKRIKMSNWAFDRAILAMAKNGYFLTRNAHPTGSLTDAEKEMMIPDGAGNYYFAINPREDAEPEQMSLLRGRRYNRQKRQDGGHGDQKSEYQNDTPNTAETLAREHGVSPAGPGRGGSRAGAGRPAVKTKVKRVQLQGARIPGWLMDWLKVEGDMGNKIEQALIEKYGLTPPEI